jgi:putative tricarboxylic transport membrane protein
MDIDFILAILTGTITGAAAGLLPGIGPFGVMILLMPYLQTLEWFNIVVFYACMIMTCQYYGSISGIIFGVPGEISSVPASIAGFNLSVNGYTRQAIIYTGVGSFVGSLVGVAVLLLIFQYAKALSIEQFFTNDAKFITLAVAATCIILFSSRQYFLNFALFTAGVGISLIGFNSQIQTNILGQYAMFETGIPPVAVMFGVMVLPGLVSLMRSSMTRNVESSNVGSDTVRLSWPFVGLGSLIGTVTGMIPGVSFILSSNLAYSIAQKFKRSSQNQQYMNQLISSETANNTGAVLALIPLMLLSLPVVPSEGVLLDILYEKGILLWGKDQSFIDNAVQIGSALLLASTAGLVGAVSLCVVRAGTWQRLFTTSKFIIALVVIAAISWLAIDDGRVELWLLTAALGFAIGVKFDRVSYIPLVMGTFLGSEVVDVIYKFIIFHS